MTIEEAIEELETMFGVPVRGDGKSLRTAKKNQALLLAIVSLKFMKEQTERPDYRNP